MVSILTRISLAQSVGAVEYTDSQTPDECLEYKSKQCDGEALPL